MQTPNETPNSRIDQLKELERQRGELLDAPRTTTRDAALEELSRLQRRIVEAVSDARRRD